MSDEATTYHSNAEERANVATHGVGAVFAFVGLVAAAFATLGDGTLRLVTVVVFCSTMLLTYVASTGFHLAVGRAVKQRWRLLDHASIYLLIAGTYTPIMLVAVGGVWGWSITAAVWTMAAAGVVMKVALVGKYDQFEKLDTGLYVAMGWTCVVAIVPIWNALSPVGMTLLVLGGAAYTAGVPFFLWEKLRHNHAIWHVFVLAGSAAHFGAVWMDVVQC
ncbi:MAG: hemolysin III family protein [Planctomycetota bacterium]